MTVSVCWKQYSDEEKSGTKGAKLSAAKQESKPEKRTMLALTNFFSKVPASHALSANQTIKDKAWYLEQATKVTNFELAKNFF